MSYSLTFDSVDLTDYGLLVVSRRLTPSQAASSVQLPRRSYSFDSKLKPKSLSFVVVILGTSRDNVENLLDSVGLVLNKQDDCALIIGALSDRYWNARFVSLDGDFVGLSKWRGTLDFVANDPCAYDVTEEDNDHTINADPTTITETPGGNEIVRPVWTWTPQDTYAGITIHNTTIDEELTWTGAITAGQDLEIDTVHWTVKLDGVSSMNISGVFPRLYPGVANSIEISDAWGAGDAAGNLNIKYRNRYL